MPNYPGALTPETPEFDALELANFTAKIVCQKDSLKYTGFYCTAFYGGVSTGYVVGCNLRCIFCWADPSRDNPLTHGQFYTPQEAFQQLAANARRSHVHRLRLSGGEPTLCRSHLLDLLGLVENSPYHFILETNGLLLGQDETYAKELAKFKKLYVRVSFKAGTADGFALRAGAWEEYYELPFRAVSHLKKYGICFGVAAMCDPKIMPREEKAALLGRLHEIAGRIHLEQETCKSYQHALVRLRLAGCTDVAEQLASA